MESILTSVKKMLGIPEDVTEFDADIIMHINSAFNVLRQLGIGPAKGFIVEDDSSNWTDFIEDQVEVAPVKTYMYAKVRLIFDPPQNSSLAKCLEQTVNEFEWRMYIDAELKEEGGM